MPNERFCFALDLKDDAELIGAYRDWHQPGKVPGVINASIREAGIADLEIYQVGDRMFMIMEVTPAFDPAKKAAADAASEDVQAWETLMWRYQQALTSAKPGEKWLLMEKVFGV